MKILYVTGFDPRGTDYGAPQRTHNLWRALQQIGDVYTICMYPKEGVLSDKLVATKAKDTTKGLKKLLNKIINKFWFLFDKDAVKMYPFGYQFTYEKPFGNIKFDAVVCRYIEPAAMLHLWKIAPLYVDFDDDPIQAFKTRDALRLPKWKRPIALLLLRLIVWIVKHKMTAGWIANPEQSSVSKKRPILPLNNIPHFPSEGYNPYSEREPYIFSVGFMEYPPNYLGVDEFIHTIWKPLHEQYPHLQYLIMGKGAPKNYVEGWSQIPGVRYMGFVEDLESIYEKALATVVAVDSGSGTCIKTLESLAHSRVCLSRPFGARGIKNQEKCADCGLYVYENFSEFSQYFEDYVLDADKRTIKEKSASNFCINHYGDVVFRDEVSCAFKLKSQ